MANLSKIKRDNMIAFLEELKKTHADDASIRAFNEIENHLREKKYGLVWEEHSEEVDELLAENIPVLTADPERRLCKDESLPWNFIIEGDNLQALYLLEKTHKGKVDCIYIDPPYNTGAKDWKYNNNYVAKEDEYRHSKWLSMMKNRLLLARRLLNPTNSVLIVAIDENELHQLTILLQELFPNCKIQMVSVVANFAGASIIDQFNRVDEQLLFVQIGNARPQLTTVDTIPATDDGKSKNTSTSASVRWEKFLRSGGNSRRQDTKAKFFPVFIDEEKGEIVGCGDHLPLEFPITPSPLKPEGCIEQWPISQRGTEACWQLSAPTFREYLKAGRIKLGNKNKKTGTYAISFLTKGHMAAIERGELIVEGKDEHGTLILRNADNVQPLKKGKTVWTRKDYFAREYGSNLIRDMLPGRIFPYPKSVYAVRDALRYYVQDKPNALIIDFFAGSGTTFHAVNLLNMEDNGNRKCIMVTNNELSADEEKRLKEEGYKKGDEVWENLGIAKYITWPRTICSISGVDIKGNPLKGEYLSTDANGNPISMSKGFVTNIKYFKCDWTPRKPEDYLLSNVLCLHIREMIELQNAIEIDNVKNVLILNKTDFKNIIMNPDVYAQIENIWVNQNIILNSEELKLLEAKGFKYIPREFFGQELREAAE